MRVSGIIHQQICQLKWHLLACLGLIMVLPVEEAIVHLKAGEGFFTTAMAFSAILFTPLLTGLIACANVQADLNEQRYIFWRSKPANVILLITLKFFIGLAVSLLIIACPVLFSLITNIIWNKDGIERVFFEFFVPLSILISIMSYSLCFASNVLVRKTARAWLIGMLMVGFLLVLPFMLPLDLKDFVDDVLLLTFRLYLAIVLAASAGAFVFSLYAAKYDWHLRTNLKSLLWVGAGLVFILLMLVSSQVANIKVLHEKEIEDSRWRRTMDYVGSRIVFQGHSYVDTDKNSISLNSISGSPYFGTGNLRPWIEGYRVMSYPRDGRLYKNVGADLYSFVIYVYYRTEGRGSTQKRFYEKIYLKSYKHTGESWTPVCELDISDCITDRINAIRVAMRLIDNSLIACVNDSCVVVDTTDPAELKIIEKKLDVLRKYLQRNFFSSEEEFTIPLIPIEKIGLQERIKLSIDLNYMFEYGYYGSNDIFESSIVDVLDGKFTFCFLRHEEVARYDVTRWDDEKIYCKFSALRPFTILEVVTDPPIHRSPNFVKNGKFYCYNYHNLMVFDIRSNRRIRKLGHFVRMDYQIDDMVVLENGNMLLCVQWNPQFTKDRSKEEKKYLYLLKNPE
jgi:hypothetical protein